MEIASIWYLKMLGVVPFVDVNEGQLSELSVVITLLLHE